MTDIKSPETCNCENSMIWLINITKMTDITKLIDKPDKYEDRQSQMPNFIT